MEKIVIYTDLDGTFLNHHNYSFEDSLESIAIIKEKQIPLVFTTSKTRVEVELLQKKVGISSPFIVENGAAIFFPKNDFPELSFEEVESYKVFRLGLKYNDILKFYYKYKEEFSLKGFSDMTVDEISLHTGLDREHSEYAQKREFSEPFITEKPGEMKKLEDIAIKEGMKITRGGRFFHLIGKMQDKGLAIREANKIFISRFNHIKTIGLGDSQNDIPLLKEVDVPIVIKKHDGTYLDFTAAQKSSREGARGWNEKILGEIS